MKKSHSNQLGSVQTISTILTSPAPLWRSSLICKSLCGTPPLSSQPGSLVQLNSSALPHPIKTSVGTRLLPVTETVGNKHTPPPYQKKTQNTKAGRISVEYSQLNFFDVANSVGKTLIRRMDSVLARILNSQLKGSEFDNEPHKPLLRSKYLGHACNFLPESESFWSPLVPTVKGSLLFGAFSFAPSPRSTLGVLIDKVFSLSYSTGEKALEKARSRRQHHEHLNQNSVLLGK